jgi:dihydroorotase
MKIRTPDDFHVHLRQGAMLKAVLPATSEVFGRALVMPNTQNPILTADDICNYRKEIIDVLLALSPKHHGFHPLMTFKIVPSTDPASIKELKSAGAIAGKLYPEGVTTNSSDGVHDYQALYPVFEEMSAHGIVLCIHAEKPGVFSLDRERKFLKDVLKIIVLFFPKLKIVVEHVTTIDGIEFVNSHDNVAATITLHHMMLTLDDIIGGSLNPHAFCKPVAKREEDRLALCKAAMSGSPKFFLGSDSAPHDRTAKECGCGAAGIYSAPVLMPALVQLFEDNKASDIDLEKFCSRSGADFYGLPLNSGYIELENAPYKVPSLLFYQQSAGIVSAIVSANTPSIVPFLAGQTLRYEVV